ncbi:MAG: GH3 auxin-responsive promoter family protein [Gammaproteobacteria bacterium]|nr:GH3 auxin-responsive promoter family protein [Gammaproteobacteria bacterium]
MKPPSRLSYELFKQVLSLKAKSNYKALLNATKNPRETQSATLLSILGQNASTDYGRACEFASITSTEDFQQRVPIATFEHLRPYINQQRKLGTTSLTQETPIYFNRTSGTTGTPKDVPITPTTLLEIQQLSQVNAYVLASQSNVLRHKIFAIGGAEVEDRTEQGIPIGSASGMLYRQQSKFVSSRYVLQPEVFDIKDIELRYLVCAILGVRERFVSTIVAANPSTLIRLCSIINLRRDEIIKAVMDHQFPDAANRVSLPRINRSRLSELKTLFENREQVTFEHIWPELQGVIAWGGGSCGFALDNLSPLLPSTCRFIEMGYLSSEFRGTINIDLRNNVCIPPLHHTFFEFVEQDDWENERKQTLHLHELELGKSYYIFATTSNGLYRYDINDIVRVIGFVNATPALEFVQKGRGTTNITGEKVTEQQVLLCMQFLRREYDLKPVFFIVLADEQTARYLLCIETKSSYDETKISTEFDTKLQQLNIEYKSKRESQRLAPMIARRLTEGTGVAFHNQRVADGQRASQFKYPHLLYLNEFPSNYLA